MIRGRFAPILAVLLGAASIVMAQSEEKTLHGRIERIKVHGKSLEGNLEGDSPNRDVSIYLPPSYATERNRRYPVIYLLHGYTDSDELWFGSKPHFINIPVLTDRAFSSGSAREMIIVLPNAYTVYQGSMYSSSVTTGDWETFIARDLVAYIDSHYRTIPEAASRRMTPVPARGLSGRCAEQVLVATNGQPDGSVTARAFWGSGAQARNGRA